MILWPMHTIRFFHLALFAVALVCAHAAFAEPPFGNAVDAFCTNNGRTPATPFAGNCAICHNPLDDDRDQTPGYNQFLAHEDDGDFSYFCPLPNQTPTLIPIGNQLVDEGGMLELNVFASDPDPDVLLLEAANLPTGAAFYDNGDGTAMFVWLPDFDQAGNYPVLFKVTDDGSPPASDSETVVITVGDVNRPPVLDPIGNQTILEGERLVLPLGASDPDLDPVQFGISGAPAGAEFLDLGNGSAEFSWLTGPGDAGNFTVTFSAMDTGVPIGSDSETIVITVGNINRPPVLAPIGNRQVLAGEQLRLGLTASDPDGDQVVLNMTGIPDGATFVQTGNGSATLFWTPRTDQVGNHALTCVAVDDGVPTESDSESFTISVGQVNRPPVLNDLVLMEDGSALRIPLTASDPDGGTLSFTTSGAPSDSSFLDNGDGTAEFSWEPAADLSGDFPILFTVTDDGIPPESDSAQIVIALTAAPPATGRGSSSSVGWGCGIGFELVMLLPPLMWLRDRSRRRRSTSVCSR
jgi:hypothetical protein